MEKKRRRWPRRVLLVGAGMVVVLGLVASGYVVRNVAYSGWDERGVDRAGFAEKQAEVNGSRLNYAEGPDHGPPLLLIHGQVTDWHSWNRVLPDLAEQYHVFAVDCYGHGRSAHVPEKYTANALTDDLREFLKTVVGEPATVAGHSSGGLVAAGLAAAAPDQVRSVVLEDPPFFSSMLPRAKKTWNYVDLSSAAHGFLQSGEDDFVAHYLRHGAMWTLFGPPGEKLKKQALDYHEKHPGEPVRLFYLPPSINELFRAMDSYDPRFGETFYDGSFNRDFDHADILSRIEVPATLIHTNWQYSDKGILLGAMDGNDAARARSSIDDVTFHKVDSGHGFHFEDADRFVDIVMELEDRVTP